MNIVGHKLPPDAGLEEVKLWIAEHDGRIDAWWEAQHEWNARMEKWSADVSKEIANLWKKVALPVALASMFATAITVLVAQKLLS